MQKNLVDIPSLFIPAISDEQTFYRPISREVYDFFMYKIFGLSAIAFHLINTSLIFIISFLVFKLSKMLSKSFMVANLSVVMYLFSAIHSVELFYLSSVQTLFSTLFALTCLLSYVKYSQKKNNQLLFISIFSFIFAILSHESSVVILPIILLFEYLNVKILDRNALINILKCLSPFAIILSARVLIFYFIIGLPEQNVYQPNLSPKSILNTISWLILWSFGLPELLPDFMTLSLSINTTIFKWYPVYFLLVVPAFLLFISITVLLFLKCVKLINRKNAIFYIGAYVISLIPFIFFPNHKFSYYLSFSIVWLALILGLILGLSWNINNKSKILVIIAIVCYLIVSTQTTSLNKITHWAAKRALAAEYLVIDLKRLYPNIQKETVFYIRNNPDYPFIADNWGTSSKQAFYIMSGSDALQLIYKDPTIQVYYEDINVSNKNIITKEFSDNVINYIAKFPY